jgi:NIMA (never in mitosis gene a)-related kinase
LKNDTEKQHAQSEVRFLSSLQSSKHIVGYKAAFIDEVNNHLCIIMEYANDGDLLGKIKQVKGSNIPFKEADIWKVLI